MIKTNFSVFTWIFINVVVTELPYHCALLTGCTIFSEDFPWVCSRDDVSLPVHTISSPTLVRGLDMWKGTCRVCVGSGGVKVAEPTSIRKQGYQYMEGLHDSLLRAGVQSCCVTIKTVILSEGCYFILHILNTQEKHIIWNSCCKWK